MRPTKNKVVMFNPMPVRPPQAGERKQTTSLQVPLVNVPLSLLALARMIRQDFDVKIINAPVDSNPDGKVLAECDDALCLAVSSMTCYQIRHGINVCAAVKKRYPDLPVIWGGYHPSTEPSQTLVNPDIDIVIRGQGELTFREAVERLRDKRPLEGIPGISYRDGARIVSNPDRKFTDINSFPVIPYDMIDVEKHVKGYKFGKRCIDYYSSQGCASGCAFCSEPLFCGRRWSGIAPERVVFELSHLADTYDIDTFMMRDSDFFLNLRRLRELCRLLIEKDTGIRLVSVNGRMERLSRLDDATWALAREAGVCELFVGFESGYQPALDAMQKGAKVSQIDACVEKCIKHDVDLRGSFMVGIPGIDVMEEVRSTLYAIHGMLCAYGERGRLAHTDVLLSFFTPYPNTRLYQAAIENGLAPLETLADWGDFDQFDFRAPWMPDELFGLVREFRNALPANSGCSFDEWCEFFREVEERL